MKIKTHAKTAKNPHNTAPFNTMLTLLLRMMVNDQAALG